jgi:O-glycosyl hydrolase
MCGIVCALVLSPIAVAAAAAEVTELSIDLRDQGKPYRGWGTSLAWWAHGAGAWPEQTVDRLVHLIVDPKEGLGLNVFRYNIGGGDAPDHHHLRRWGDVPGFKPTADSPYDWTADANQRRVLLKLIAASKQANTPAIVEAFSNSASWWMTTSGCASGAQGGGANLPREKEQAFADYLADVCKFYQDQHGVTFATLEPFNEPDVNWWKAGHTQEGMHVPRDQQARLIRAARAALDALGLKQTLISATDANSIDDCVKSLTSYDDATLAALGQVNTHSYGGRAREALRYAAEQRKKPVWQSETGPLYVRGNEYEQILVVAQRLVLDVNQLRPEVWCTWQMIDRGPWGCFHEERGREDVRVAKMFNVLALFTRHVRPGDRFVNLDSDRVIAAVSKPRGQIAIVLVNADASERTFKLALRGAEKLPATVAAIRTTADQDLAATDQAAMRDGVLEATTPAQSVTCVTLSARVN